MAADGSVDIDINTIVPFSDTFSDNDDVVSLSANVVGGDVETFTVAKDAQTLELLYTTKAKITVKVAPTDGYDDALVTLKYNGISPDYYKVVMCAVTSSLVTCSEREDVTYNSNEGWARFYLKNNELYDNNQFGVPGRSGIDGKAITDKIDVDIYLARSYNADDFLSAVGGGGGGCTVSNSSAYGLSVLIFFCVIFLMRRKIVSATKAHEEKLRKEGNLN